MNEKLCPINWTKEDGPCPCAFKNRHHECESQTECIKMYEARYKKDLKDSKTLVPILCPWCQKPTNVTKGDIKKGWVPLCKDCSKDYQNGQILIAHVSGKI